MENNKISRNKKSLILGSVGTIMEYYDFALFGYFTPILAQLFFPGEDKLTALISTFGIFGAGFFMRPIGAILFGHLADKKGRKLALIVSVLLMAISTTLIGLLPTYKDIGLVAPILLALVRMLQGVSTGGEFSGSVSFVVENAPTNKRGFYGSWIACSVMAGMLLGSTVGSIVTSSLTQNSVIAWGWRVPFLIGLLLGAFAIYLRRELEESPIFNKLQECGDICCYPVKNACKIYWKEIILVIITCWIFAVSLNIAFIYMPTYISSTTTIKLSTALQLNSLSMLFLIIIIPILGLLSDKIGRKVLLITSCVGFILLSYPLFLLVQQSNFWLDLFVLLVFSILVGILQGAFPTYMAELFPTKVRVSAMSIGYNIGQAIFAGTAALLATFLIKQTGNDLTPAMYLMFSAFVSLIAFVWIKETYKNKLD